MQIKWPIGVLVFGLLIFSGLFFSGKIDLFKIREVEVTAQNTDCVSTSDIRSYIISANYSFFTPDKSFENRIKNKYFCVGEVIVKKDALGKVELDIKGRQAIAKISEISADVDEILRRQLKLDDQDATASSESSQFTTRDYVKNLETLSQSSTTSANFLVDKLGIIFAEVASDATGAASISIFEEELKLGKNIGEEKMGKVSEIITKLTDLEISREDIILVGGRLIVNSQIKVLFSLDKRIDYQLASLQLILQRAKMNSRLVESVDLRFDKPVVVYAPKKKL